MTSTTSNRVRDLNDAFRAAGPVGGQWMLTRAVQAEGPEFIMLAINAVRSFDGFTGDNDPYGEHDFGSFDVAGRSLFWKIDYYDLSLSYGSDDPANPALTRRVITIMLGSDY